MEERRVVQHPPAELGDPWTRPAAHARHLPAVDETRCVDPVLYVVTCITNPEQYARRYELYHEFEARLLSLEPRVQLYTCEGALADRPFEVTSATNPRHIQVRCDDALWHKENLINLAVQRLPNSWRYVAWIDADVQFINPNWHQDTIHQLQQFPVVQLFTHAIDLGPAYETMHVHHSFASLYAKNGFRPSPAQGEDYYKHWHPGFAWAMTRTAWDGIGGLVDFAILGSGDHHMAQAFIGNVQASIPKGTEIAPSYARRLMQFQEHCERVIRHKVGVVPGTILHYFHGAKKNRRYVERWAILKLNRYDPDKDIRYNWQGMVIFAGNKPELELAIEAYFRQRNEDSIDND